MDLMNTLVTRNLSKLLVILLKIPAYLLQQILMTGFHLATVTLLFQVVALNCNYSVKCGS